jgi:hypothetical protein
MTAVDNGIKRLIVHMSEIKKLTLHPKPMGRLKPMTTAAI